MIPGIAALLRDCVRPVRRVVRARHAAPPKALLGLTMDDAARILAPRQRLRRAVRRAVLIGCPAGVLPVVPHVASAPGLPLPVPPAPPVMMAAPLPFGIGGGPLLPPVWAEPPVWVPTLPDLPVPPEAVPEPVALALLLAAVVLLAVVRRWAG